MAEDTTYQGWKNYPTWCVNMWLTNDEGLYNETRSRIHDLTARLEVADEIKAYVRDNLEPNLDASWRADLLGFAFDQVDWLEIADAWLAERKDGHDAA